MKATLFAAGVIMLFLAWAFNQICIPMPWVSYWQPFPGWNIPIPTIIWANPLGFLVLPLAFIGAILTVFGLTENDKLRIFLTIIIVIIVYFYLRGFHIPIPIGGG